MPHIGINSKSLFYTDTHPSSSSNTPPIITTLFLHGLGSSSCFYASVTPYVQEHTRCIALDYPGSGLSELGSEELSIESLARDAIALLDELAVEKFSVVGHSMGGILASYIASTSPDRILAVILIGPVNPAPNLAAIFQARIETIQSDGLISLADTIPTAATGEDSTALHHAFIRTLILSTSQEGYIALCNVIANATKPEYEKIKVPLRIIAGENDKTSPIEGCQGILKAYGSNEDWKTLDVLKGVGHWHCVEDWENVAGKLGAFLSNIGRIVGGE